MSLRNSPKRKQSKEEKEQAQKAYEEYVNMKWDDSAFEKHVLKFLPEKNWPEALRRCRDAAARGYHSFGLWDHVKPDGEWVVDIDDIAAVNPATGYVELLGEAGPIKVSEGVLDHDELVRMCDESIKELMSPPIERFPGDPILKAYYDGKAAYKAGIHENDNPYAFNRENEEEHDLARAWNKGHWHADEEQEARLR